MMITGSGAYELRYPFECVDHFIVLGEAHLRHILRTYVLQ